MCPNVSTTNRNLNKGYFFVSSMGMYYVYINLLAILLDSWLTCVDIVMTVGQRLGGHEKNAWTSNTAQRLQEDKLSDQLAGKIHGKA